MFLSARLLGWCLKHWIDAAMVTVDSHAVLTSESVRHVSFVPKQLVDLFVKTMVKFRIPLCAKEIRKRLTYLQGEELACPAEDDEQFDELVDQPVDELVDELVDEKRSGAT